MDNLAGAAVLMGFMVVTIKHAYKYWGLKGAFSAAAVFAVLILLVLATAKEPEKPTNRSPLVPTSR